MDGEPYKAGKFAHTIRKRIFAQHLGLLDDPSVDLNDIVSDEFFDDVWMKTARTNTTAYDEVFRCLPNNHVHSWKELADWRKTEGQALCFTDKKAALEKLAPVRGHIVIVPLEFLEQEYLGPTVGAKEYLVPTKVSWRGLLAWLAWLR